MAPPPHTIPPTDTPSSTSSPTVPPTVPPAVPSTSNTSDAPPPTNTTVPTEPGPKTDLQKGALALSAVAVAIAIYMVVKALVMLPTKLLATRYSMVKDFMEITVKAMKNYEQKFSDNLGISPRALEAAEK